MTDEKEAPDDSEDSGAEPELVGDDDPQPPGVRRIASEFMAMAVRGGGPRYHPIFEKFEAEHVDKFLELSHEDEREERSIRRSNRWFRLVYVLVTTTAFGLFTVYMLPDYSDIYVEILKVVVSFFAGVAGGYGLKSHLDERKTSRL